MIAACQQFDCAAPELFRRDARPVDVRLNSAVDLACAQTRVIVDIGFCRIVRAVLEIADADAAGLDLVGRQRARDIR